MSYSSLPGLAIEGSATVSSATWNKSGLSGLFASHWKSVLETVVDRQLYESLGFVQRRNVTLTRPVFLNPA